MYMCTNKGTGGYHGYGIDLMGALRPATNCHCIRPDRKKQTYIDLLYQIRTTRIILGLKDY